MNYAKIASDSEISKDTVRRYIAVLSDTLLLEEFPSYKAVSKARRARQKAKFIFFDLGVRNSLLGRMNPGAFGAEELGHLFEQWIILQVIYYNRLYGKGWRISGYRDAMGVEVDLVIETDSRFIAVEIKWSAKAQAKMFKGLVRFSQLVNREVTPYVVYRGAFEQRFDRLGLALPYERFLENILPELG